LFEGGKYGKKDHGFGVAGHVGSDELAVTRKCGMVSGWFYTLYVISSQ
jgi:hypothetical protein